MSLSIQPCLSYHAVTEGARLLAMPDGKSFFKLYYFSIIGRDKPERYEWSRSPLGIKAFEERFSSERHEGIGFVTAFPHITKIFRFSPGREVILDVKAFDTPSMKLRAATGDADSFVEFACYAEAAVAAEEYHAWAVATSVEAYLGFLARTGDFKVLSSDKLKRRWEA